MAAELKNNSKKTGVASDRVDIEIRAGLAADPDSLLAILNTIEHSVAAGYRPKAIVKSSRRFGLLFH